MTIDVRGGTFDGEVAAEDVTKFIHGGTYSTDPTGFVGDDRYAYKMNEQYIVAPEGYQSANWVFEKTQSTTSCILALIIFHMFRLPQLIR